jgi:hypothetical protein
MNGAMWIMVTGAVIFSILAYWAERKIWPIIGGACIGFVVSGIITLLLLLVASGNPDSEEQVVWRTEYIYSLKDANSGLQGDFILGTGSISSTWYYQAYVYTDDGYHKEKFEQSRSYIKEDAHTKPTVEKFIIRTHRNWFMTWLTGNPTSDAGHYNKYILHVPKGTIIREFRLE